MRIMKRLVCCTFLMLVVMQVNNAESRISKFKYNKNNHNRETDRVVKCNELPAPVLNNVLGSAFNSRYMSVDAPMVEEENEPNNVAGKRDAKDFKPFYVDDKYAMDLSDKPAWEVMHLSELEKEEEEEDEDETQKQHDVLPEKIESNSTRVQRSNNRRRKDDMILQQPSKRPWDCEAKIKWLDLGYDYYPRYLRTVECTPHSCFYFQYTCMPRSFTVKILRRRRGECVPTKNDVGINGLHSDLIELWIWEERAVNFCCECTGKRRSFSLTDFL